MNSKITKYATAAVIIAAVLLSITFLDKTVTPAYAIEQTIEAFKNVRFLHLVRYTESKEIEDERWIEIGGNGRQIKYRQENHQIGFKVIENDIDETTAEYHNDKNTIILYSNRDQQYQWVGEITAVLNNLRDNGKIIELNTTYN